MSGAAGIPAVHGGEEVNRVHLLPLLSERETALRPLDADEPSVASGWPVAVSDHAVWGIGQPCPNAPAPSTWTP